MKFWPVGFVLVSVVLSACYRHGAAHDPSLRTARPELPPPHEACFDVLLDGVLKGDECVTVTASAGMWRMRGRRVLGTRTDTYRLEVSQQSRQPRRLDWRVETPQGALRMQAVVDQVWVHVGVQGLGHPYRRKVAYAPGTHLDFATPLASSWPLALLQASMQPDDEVSVRTIVFDSVQLTAKVELNRFRLHDRKAGQARFTLSSLSRSHPEALWLRSGRLTRARQWRRGAEGPILEWRLRTRTATSAQ